MDKRELVAATARRTSLTRRQVREALDAALETITGALAKGETVAMSDFGRFLVQSYPGRKLRRFDGEGYYFAEDRQVPVFRPSAVLRRRLREKPRQANQVPEGAEEEDSLSISPEASQA